MNKLNKEQLKEGISKWKYFGGTKNGKFDGDGVYNWPNGVEYVGKFSQGLRDGLGTYFYPNGRTVLC